MDEKYNIFISYAWRDNKPSGANPHNGWVSIFVDRLRKHLDRELPRQYSGDRIWLDYEQLRGSDRLTPTIRAKLEASRILMPIISRSYLDSPWCREELRIFLEQHGSDSGRIFPVWMEPAENLPPPLDDLLKYPFWYEDKRQQPRIRWFPDIDATDREYGRVQQDMARDLAARLVEIWQAEPNTPKPQSSPKPAPCRPDGDHLVLVNGGEDDAALVHEVVDRLAKHHGIGAMVPLLVQPKKHGLKSSALTSDLRNKLKLCSAVLMVYQNGPMSQIHQQFNEFLKFKARHPKNHPVPTLDLCRPAGCTQSLGLYLPQMDDYPCGPDCAAECAQQFAEKLM